MFDKKIVESIIPTLNFKFPYTVDDFCENMYLENYHCHRYDSNVSTPDSPTSPEEYVERIKQLGSKCLYTMEHGWQGTWYSAYDLAQDNDLRYIFGTEAYWVKDRHENDKTNCHIIIHALNDEGRKEINYALSMANIDGYYYKPRVDLELIMAFNPENVIITSACISGWNYKDAEDIWISISKRFKNHFFLEVQYHNTEPQKELNKKILRIAKENNIQIISGLDSHYIYEKDDIRRNQILEYKTISYPQEDGWYLDYPDTQTIYYRFVEQGVLSEEEIIRAIMNTNIFASDEVTDIVFDKSFKIPTLYPNLSYEEKCKIFKDYLNKQYKLEANKSKEKAEGIRYEVNEIIKSNVVDYFLTSNKIIKDAIENEGGILTTTARGSSSSFITNKLLGFTTIDRFNADVPIYPERFLTAERVLSGSMPD